MVIESVPEPEAVQSPETRMVYTTDEPAVVELKVIVLGEYCAARVPVDHIE